jgi:hypothetical protein
MKALALALLVSALALGSMIALAAASPVAPRPIISSSPIESVYYSYHGHRYAYRYHGHYYNHRRYANGHWRYY